MFGTKQGLGPFNGQVLHLINYLLVKLQSCPGLNILFKNTFADTISITAPEAIEIDATATAETSGNDGSIDVTVDGGTAPYAYSWSNGATTPTLENIPAGEYLLYVSDANGCITQATITVESNVINSVATPAMTNPLSVYPNPTNGLVNINRESTESATLQVYDLQGRLLMTERIAGQTQVNIGHLTHGIYMMELVEGDTIYRSRIVLE